MKNLQELHKKLCPTKSIYNFWRSTDYVAATKSLSDLPPEELIRSNKAHEGSPAHTMVHPVIALAFIRWADPVSFYKRVGRIIQ